MFKAGVLWLHKWLGIISGVIVLLVSLSGAIYVFADDLKVLVYPERYMLPIDGSGTTKPLSSLIQLAESQLAENEKVTRVDLYPEKNRSWVFRAVATNPNGFGLWNYFTYYKRVFINPYSGAVIGTEDATKEFFQLTLELHMNLLLGKTFGNPIVSYATLIFVIMLISGIVLWWPRNSKRKTLQRSFMLKTKVKWKRLNYDLHNVIGFYSFIFALVLGLSGLVFSFPSLRENYIALFNKINSKATEASKLSESAENIPIVYQDPLDNTLLYLLDTYPQAAMMSIRLKSEDSPQIDVQVRNKKGRTGDFAWYYVDKNTQQVNKVVRSSSLEIGDKLAAINYDIHTGGIGGYFTKFIACLISLFCASLPITGYILWWNKTKKR